MNSSCMAGGDGTLGNLDWIGLGWGECWMDGLTRVMRTRQQGRGRMKRECVVVVVEGGTVVVVLLHERLCSFVWKGEQHHQYYWYAPPSSVCKNALFVHNQSHPRPFRCYHTDFRSLSIRIPSKWGVNKFPSHLQFQSYTTAPSNFFRFPKIEQRDRVCVCEFAAYGVTLSYLSRDSMQGRKQD